MTTQELMIVDAIDDAATAEPEVVVRSTATQRKLVVLTPADLIIRWISPPFADLEGLGPNAFGNRSVATLATLEPWHDDLGRIAADVMAEPNAVHVLAGSNHQGARSLYVENVVGRGMQ